MNYKCLKSFESVRGRLYTKDRVITESEYRALLFSEQRMFTEQSQYQEESSFIDEEGIDILGLAVAAVNIIDFFTDDEPATNSSSSSSSSSESEFGGGDFGGGGASDDW